MAHNLLEMSLIEKSYLVLVVVVTPQGVLIFRRRESIRGSV